DGRTKAPHDYYACSYNRLRGPRVCANGLRMPMASADQKVLTLLREEILDPRALALAIEQTVAAYTAQPNAEEQRADLAAGLQRLEIEIARLVSAVAAGGPLDSLRVALLDRERRRDSLRAPLEPLATLAPI